MSIVQRSENKQKEKEILYTILTTGITPLSHTPNRVRDHELHLQQTTLLTPHSKCNPCTPLPTTETPPPPPSPCPCPCPRSYPRTYDPTPDNGIYPSSPYTKLGPISSKLISLSLRERSRLRGPRGMVFSSAVIPFASVLLFPFVFVFVAAEVVVIVSEISIWSRKWTCAVVDFAFAFDFDFNLVVMAVVVDVGVDSLPKEMDLELGCLQG